MIAGQKGDIIFSTFSSDFYFTFKDKYFTFRDKYFTFRDKYITFRDKYFTFRDKSEVYQVYIIYTGGGMGGKSRKINENVTKSHNLKLPTSRTSQKVII